MNKTNEVIDYLKGSCDTLDTACSVCDIEFEDLDFELIDEAIFCCETCNWWCDVSEMEEDGICEDCYNE